MEPYFKNTYNPSGKKIAILCLKQSDKKDGIFFYAHDVINMLSRENEVTVVSNFIFQSTLKEETKKNIKFTKIPFFKSRLIKWMYLILFLPFLLPEKRKFDEIIFTTEDLPIFSFKLLKPFLFKGFKIKVVVHDLAEYFISRYSPLKDLFRRIMVKRYIKFCDEVITVSKKTKSDIVELGFKCEENISLFYNQINIKSQEIKKRIITQSYVLYVAGFDYPSKNHLGLLNLLKKFDNKKFPHVLVCAGSADVGSKNLSLIKKKIIEFGLTNKVILKTNVVEEELISLYQHCEFTVFPSLYEGFGRPIVESINYGKSVYSTDVGIFRELSKNNLVVPYSDLRKFKN